MLIVLHERASTRDVENVVARVRDSGLRAHVRRHGHQVVVLATGDRPEAAEPAVRRERSVEAVRRIGRPYILASRECQPGSTRIELGGGAAIGGGAPVAVIAGPGCVEDEPTLLEAGRIAAAAGAHVLRAAVHEVSASPYDFQGPGRAGLRLLAQVRAATGLPVLTDVRTAREVGLVSEAVDVIQVGSRDMQNFDLLREVGRQPRPVVLMRGRGSTIEEWLLAAEYVLSQGNEQVILCEPGVRGFDPVTDAILDLAAVPALRELTHLPVVVDPGQATGRSTLVGACARAAVAVGADGVMLDVHPRPADARCGAGRSLGPAELAELVPSLAQVAASLGRTLAPAASAARARRAASRRPAAVLVAGERAL